MSIITHTLHSLSTYPITPHLLLRYSLTFPHHLISILTLSHSPLTPTSLTHHFPLSFTLTPPLSFTLTPPLSLSPSPLPSPLHPNTSPLPFTLTPPLPFTLTPPLSPSPSHLPSSLHPHTSPLPFTLTPPLSLSPSPFHQLTWSPTDTTRCFSTLGLARQNQQTPGGSFSGQRLFGTGASEAVVGQQ